MKQQIFRLPDLGEGLTEAELVRWLVAVGDTIVVDQPIAEVETAKSVVEVPSPFAGTVSVLHGEEGEALAVGAPLIEVGEQAVVEAEAVAAAEATVDAASSGSGNVLVGYGTTELHHSGRRRVRRGAVAAPSTVTQARTGPVPVISPVVRTLARTHGIDLATVRATGEGGVVTRRDVEAAFATARARSTAAAPATASATAPATAPMTASSASSAESSTTPTADQRTGLTVRASTPFSLFRRTVAANMTRSRSEIPEATVWVDVDATELWDVRRRLRVGDRTPSLLSFVARFTLAALARRPELAGRVTADGSGLDTFDGVNLGFAVDSPRGLIVPVVRRADLLTIRELDGAFERLTRDAREGTLAPAQLSGSTFTINNYGSLGVDGSAAIINHPEVAILGIGRMIERPWVVEGAVVPRRIAQLSLVFDHRVTDGGVAAGLLRDIADAMESPLTLVLDASPD